LALSRASWALHSFNCASSFSSYTFLLSFITASVRKSFCPNRALYYPFTAAPCTLPI
jgi:hypothetical protein